MRVLAREIENPGAECTANSLILLQSPTVITAGSPTTAILREQGVNGQVEMAAAFLAAGFDCVDLHMSDLSSGARHLSQFQAFAACGGFSYGDVLGAGGGWAKAVLVRRQPAPAVCRFFCPQTHWLWGLATAVRRYPSFAN